MPNLRPRLSRAAERLPGPTLAFADRAALRRRVLDNASARLLAIADGKPAPPPLVLTEEEREALGPPDPHAAEKLRARIERLAASSTTPPDPCPTSARA